MRESNFEYIRKIKKEIERPLLLDKDIVSIGTIKEEDKSGNDTGRYFIRIGLISKADPIIIDRIRKKISALLAEKDRVAAHAVETQDVQIIFVEEGEIRALSANLPSADDVVTFNLGANTKHIRPIMGGFSVGHTQVSAGTLGGFVSFDAGDDREKYYILSNNHVLAQTNAPHLRDRIIQPGTADGGAIVDKVATLTHFHSIDFGTSAFNKVDAAIAEVDGSTRINLSVKSIGIPGGMKIATVGMNVEKSGRTTGHTYGKVISVDESTMVKMGQYETIFADQILTTSMSSPGDSGSIIFEKGTRQAIGLLFAGSQTATYCNHITDVSHAMSHAGFFGMRFPKKVEQKNLITTHYPRMFSQNLCRFPKSAARLIPGTLRCMLK